MEGHPSDGGTRGSVYGFAITSRLDLRYLRSGDGDPLEVVEGAADAKPTSTGPLIMEWEPRPWNPFEAKLFHDDGAWNLWVRDTGWYRIDPIGGRIEVPAATDTLVREERLWGIPTALCFLPRGDRSMHAASVEVDGRAVIIAAPGRHGKTTLAAALMSAGHRLLAEDTTCCRYGEEISVIPGPAMLRIRPDSHDRLALTNIDILSERQDRVHVAVPEAERGDTRPVPVAGVVLLREGEEIRLEPADPAGAIRDLWALSFRLPTDEDRIQCLERLSSLATLVPVWDLYRPLRYESIDATIDVLVRTLDR